MTQLPTTLGLYVARQTLIAIMIAVFAFGVLAFLIDLIEQLRSAAARGSPSLHAMSLAALRVPGLLDRIWPFAVLFGSMIAFWRLNRAQELVAVRAAGVSAWQFLTPACIAAALLGAFVVTSLNPLSAAFSARYERMENAARGDDSTEIAVVPGGAWLRLIDDDRRHIMSAKALRADEDVELETVTILVYDTDDRYAHRLDAAAARLVDGAWILADATRSDRHELNRPVGDVRIATQLSPETIRRSFRGPETLSFWELPEYIDLVEDLGFSAREHRVHWHQLMATPALFAAMLLIGVAFTLRFERTGSSRLLPFGLLAGFGFFILVDVVKALGISGQLPIAMAAWAPACIALLAGSAALFQLEDG